MKDFVSTLQHIYGVKPVYPINQIIDAYNCFCRNQIKNIEIHAFDKRQLKTQGYYEVIEPNHKWLGRKVKSSMIENKDGMVTAYFGTQSKHFHKSMLK